MIIMLRIRGACQTLRDISSETARATKSITRTCNQAHRTQNAGRCGICLLLLFSVSSVFICKYGLHDIPHRSRFHEHESHLRLNLLQAPKRLQPAQHHWVVVSHSSCRVGMNVSEVSDQFLVCVEIVCPREHQQLQPSAQELPLTLGDL